MAGAVEVVGLREFRQSVAKLGDVGASKEFKQAGYVAAERVVIPAATMKASSLGRMQRRAAYEGLAPVRTMTGGAVRLSDKVFAGSFGAEFGAFRNQRRLIKNTRGRATMVRGDTAATIRRVEAQTIAYDRYGAPTTVRKKARQMGATAVRVTNTMIGWNQFRTWRGSGSGSGYFLWPAIREEGKAIAETFAAELDPLLKRLEG